MDITTGAIGSILSKLAHLLKSEYMRQTGVKDQADALTKELQHVDAFLQKIAKVAPDQLDEQVKVWASEVREASYDMEDILDSFLVRVEGPAEPISKKRKLFEMLQSIGSYFSKAKDRHNISTVIEQVNSKVREIAERRQRYRLDDCVVSVAAPSSQIDPRIALVHRTNTSLLVGIDERKDAVIKMLSQQDSLPATANKTKVVSLLGFGGVGKTTIAKATYDQLKDDYQCGAFVSVGQKPNLEKVLKDILIYLDKDKFRDIHAEKKGADFYIRELLDFLRDKRYLIVVDDVWETQSRRRIIEALAENDIGSRIIITTRNSEVAIGDVYKVQPLSEDNSKKLLYTRIFGGENKCPHNEQQEAYEIAHRILRKCGGVPLAIMAMGSLLVGKSMKEWLHVCNSIVFHDKHNDQLDDTMWILSLSYYDLPSHLKTCLLYLSVFPKDYFIRKDTLIWMWICEGFVDGEPGTELFEIGEGYFSDLINRSLIQPVEEKKSTIIKGCRVHDMVLDLIRHISREANFAIVSDNGEHTLFGSNPRRLALQNIAVKDTPRDSHMDKRRARSFIACSCHFGSWVLVQSFKLLRVLNLDHCKFTQFDEHVGNLLHLRFLGIYSQGSYRNLTWPSHMTPSIGMLRNLVCLHAFRMVLPNGVITRLTSLQDLHIYPATDDKSRVQFVKDLGNLRELRVLRIDINRMDKETQSDLWTSLGNLHKMQRLELLHGSIFTGDEAGCNGGLPSCLHPSRLPNLSCLYLVVVSLSDQALEILGGLPQLSCLTLSVLNGKATVTGTAAHCYFQKLRSCVLLRLMVQLVVNEADSSVSLTVCHTSDTPAASGSTGVRQEQVSCRVARAVMPNLEALRFYVNVVELADTNGSCDNLGLECLASLRKVKAYLNCFSAPVDVVKREEAALRQAVQIHPNQPTLEIKLV